LLLQDGALKGASFTRFSAPNQFSTIEVDVCGARKPAIIPWSIYLKWLRYYPDFCTTYSFKWSGNDSLSALW